ncbi:MAG: PTS sugar transporter subunit IIA [Opitutales bacterium]|nr:PTS sugar transporter subunit IIA [Opitutales bacterium]
MKPQDALTIGEVAANFGWSTRFVEGLVRSEKIPGLHINGQFLFRREDIIDWLDQKIQTLDARRLSELEKKLEADLDEASASKAILSHRLFDSLDKRAIQLGLPLSSKRTVLDALVGLAVATGNVLDDKHLLASLIERESLLRTALPGGLAICHPRRPLPSAISDTVVAFLRTREPIAFGAEKGEKTHLFFLLCAPDDHSHLHGLSRLARVLRTETIDQLKSEEITTPEEVLALLRETVAAL